MKEQFREFSERMACWTGTYWAFLLALVVVAAWALTGPIFSYSDTWQLFINTGTTVITLEVATEGIEQAKGYMADAMKTGNLKDMIANLTGKGTA